jgi:dTMP kinase
LLFCAARAELVERVIRPALAAGRDVVCDRFVDSTTAYQGAARGLDPGLVARLNEAAVAGCMPDRTVLLRIGLADAAGRAEDRGGPRASDRFEREDEEFHARIAAAFDEIAAADPERVAVVDGDGTVEEVHARVVEALGA